MNATEGDIQTALEGSPGQVERWMVSNRLVQAGGATSFVANQSYLAASSLVSSADPLIHRCIAVAQAVVPARIDLATGLLHLQLAMAVGSPWLGVSASFTTGVGIGLVGQFRSWLLELHWTDNSELRIASLPSVPYPGTRTPIIKGRAVAYVAAAAMDRYIAEADQEDYQYKLERIRSLLGLRPSELARLLSVTGEGLRQWQAGGTIAVERRPDIDHLYETTMWLAEHIVPQALPSFVRRGVPVLNHQTVLDWLASRRFAELRSIYERGFSGEISG